MQNCAARVSPVTFQLFTSSPPPTRYHHDLSVFPQILVQVCKICILSSSLLFLPNLSRQFSAKWPHFYSRQLGLALPLLSPALAATTKPNSQQRPSLSLPFDFLSFTPIAHYDPVVAAWLGGEGDSET